MSMDVSGITSMLNQTGATNASNQASTAKTDALKGSVNGLSSSSTDEELMEIENQSIEDNE